MEEDIKILEELLNANISFNIRPTDYGYKAIENLINKYKEQEKMVKKFKAYSKSVYDDYANAVVRLQEKDKIIDLMAEYIFAYMKRDDICAETKKERKHCYMSCIECVKDYFKKKARDENV